MPSLTRLLSFSLILTAAILFASVRNAQAQSPDTKSKETGSISGRVTVGEKGAPGIVVAAFGGDGPNRTSIAKATTDIEGRYRLFGLAAAQYQVTALAPSLAMADSGSNANSYYGSGKSILLSASESVEDVDLKLVRGSVITGRVTDSESKPVVEQQISIQAVDQNGAPTRQSQPNLWNYQMNQTDDRGVYRLYGLPAGHYKISVGNDPKNGSISFNNHSYYPLTFYPDVNDPAKATIVELSQGSEATNIDIQVGHRAETYAATGRVVDADTGQPVSGARFMYGPAPRNQEFRGGYISAPIMNPRGEFRIDGLEPGRYGVAVSSYDTGSFYSDPIFFEVTSSDVSGLEVKAVAGLSLSGIVVTEGTVNKDVLAQLATLRVSASVTSDSNPQSRTSGSSIIGADGSFQINGLRPGKASLYIYVAASSSSLRGLSIARIERDGVEQPRVIDIAPGQSVSGLRVVVIFGTGVIRGAVKFEGGTPPPDARIFVSVRREGSTGSSGAGAPVDSRGRFLIGNLASGTYEVTLQLGFSTPPQPPQRPPAPQKQFVIVADGTEAEVTFTVDLKPKEGGP